MSRGGHCHSTHGEADDRTQVETLKHSLLPLSMALRVSSMLPVDMSRTRIEAMMPLAIALRWCELRHHGRCLDSRATAIEEGPV